MSLETRLAALVSRLGQQTKATRLYRPGGFQADGFTRRMRYHFGSAGVDSVTTYNTGHQRMAFQLPVGVKQWRLVMSNRPPTGAAPTAPAITCNGVWFGEAFRDATSPGPNSWFVGNPTQALNSFTIPANGGEYVSPWVTAANLIPSDPTKPYQISMGWTKTVNGSVIYRGAGGAANTTVAADASTGALFIGWQVAVMFSVAIEYEFEGGAKTLVALGDSNTEGWGCLTLMQSWHQRASRRLRMPCALSGDFGNTADGFANAALTEPAWSRITGLNIDAAIVSLGTNDSGSGRTLAQYQASIFAIRQKLVSIGIKDVFFTTIAPHGQTTTNEALRKSYNTWLLSGQPDALDVFDFNKALESTVGANTLRTEYHTGDGIHWDDEGHQALNLCIPGIG